MRGLSFILFVISVAISARAETLSFELHEGLIFVEGRISGREQPLQLILDSGAEESVLSVRAASELAVVLASPEPVQGVSGLLSAYRSEPVELKVGSKSTIEKGFLVLGLERESKILGKRIDGLIGADFLHGKSVRIDYLKKRIDFDAPEMPDSGLTKLEIVENYGALCIPVVAEGVQLQMVRVDTGCTKGLCWSPPKDANLRFPLGRGGAPQKADVRIGEVELSRVNTLVFRAEIFPGEDGLLGSEILQKFDAVWIDCRNGWIGFEGEAVTQQKRKIFAFKN